MPNNTQSNKHSPIGFSPEMEIPTKGGSVELDERQGTRDKGREIREEGRGDSSRSSLVPRPLSSLEERLIACFVEVAAAFNLPRSMGEIFGLLYASEEPVCFEGIRERLQLSKATTSTGLKELQRIGVVHAVYVAGDRRSFYRPEEDLDKGFRDLIGETMLPRLKRAWEQAYEQRAISRNSSALLLERLSHLNLFKEAIQEAQITCAVSLNKAN